MSCESGGLPWICSIPQVIGDIKVETLPLKHLCRVGEYYALQLYSGTDSSRIHYEVRLYM